MICKCNTEMKELIDEYGGNESKIGEYSYCPKCGRIYFHCTIITRNKTTDFWIEPELTKKYLGDE